MDEGQIFGVWDFPPHVCRMTSTPISASGPLHKLFPLPERFSSQLFTWLIPTHHSGLKTQVMLLVLEGFVGLHITVQLQLLQHQQLGHRLG